MHLLIFKYIYEFKLNQINKKKNRGLEKRKNIFWFFVTSIKISIFLFYALQIN